MDVGNYPELTIEGYPVVGDSPLYHGKQPVLFLAAFPYLYLPDGKVDISGRMTLNATWHASEDHPFTADYTYFRAYFTRNQPRTLDKYATEQGWTLTWTNPPRRDFFLFVEVRDSQKFALAQGKVASPVFNISAVGVDPNPDGAPYGGDQDGDDIPAILYTGDWLAGASDLDDHIKVGQQIGVTDLDQDEDGRFTLRLNWRQLVGEVADPRTQLRVKKLVQQDWIEVRQAEWQGDFVAITDRDFTAYALARVSA